MVIALRTMVRPWMVAILQVLPLLLLLMPLSDRSFRIGRPAGAIAAATTVVAHAEAAPATTGDETDATAVDANTTEVSVGCNYKGRSYEPGSLVNTDQPCLKCTCVIGNLVCHLQVCPELPDPPPQGCVIVHKKNKCCAHLQCFYEQLGAVHSKLFSLQNVTRSGPARMENSAFMTFNGLSKGCVVNGTIYAEGSAMGSSSLCEYCYCIKGHQQCVRPQCSLNIPGCTAVYKKHTCCPIKYKCSPSYNALIKNTTEAPSTEMPSSLSARLKDCRINGRLISLGEPVIGVARSSCETCFCINGQVRCDKVICPPIRAQISPNCGPVYSEGHCCPTSYNCSSSTSNNESHVSSTTATTMTTTTPTTTTIVSSSTVTIDMLPSSSTLSLTSTSSSSPQTMSTNIFAETKSTSNAIVNDLKNNTDLMMEDPMESRHANPASLMQDDFGGLNMTEKSNNFEMDYYEPTLPPSLPNLKIIPFVAADAVVDKPAAVYDNYQPVVERVYNVSEVEETPLPALNSFSPPIETEGGFMPKDPPDGAIYVPDKFRTTTEHHVPILPIQSTTIVNDDKPVVGHRPMGSVWCMSNGKKYKHGELLTDPSACNICICFNANIVCQENCPAVKVGCQRISDPSNSTCCGRIICNESENDETTEEVKMIELTSEATTTTKKNKDAIIEHIVYFAPSTDKSVSTSSPATTVRHVISSEPTTLKPLTFTTKLLTTLAPITTEKLAIFSSSVPKKRVEITTPIPKPTDDEDYSFESMFSFLFSSDTQEQSSSTPSQISSTNNIEAETRIEHRTDDEIDEKVHLVDTKPQTNSVTLSELFKTNQNSNTEQYSNIQHADNKQSSGIKPNSEDKNNNFEPQDVNKPVEVKPISETNKHVDFKPHFEIKQNADADSDSETKYKIGAKPQSEIKQHNDMKPNLETKPHVEASLHSGVNQQAEVKTHFEVKENDQSLSQFNFKYHDDVKPHQDFSKHQTEVKSHFDVQEHSEVKPQSNLKHESDVKTYPDYKYPTEIKSQFDVKDKVAVKPYFDFKQHTAEVTTFSIFKQHGDESSLPEIKQHNEIKPNVSAKPLKTKVDTEFNLVASMLKISGCNIYGRMYRVGKIIAELSNPCLECMCTEIGVHCNQLKC